ncbi:hypothetical protein ACFL40_04155 [candidate division KSB1 bacterium]
MSCLKNAESKKEHSPSRRSFIKTAMLGTAGISLLANSCSKNSETRQRKEWPGTMEMREKTFEELLSDIYIVPGAWRPHCPYEHIAWVKPPWMTRDYIWLDFPEAIFSSQGLLYLSHFSPSHPQAYPDEPKVPWNVNSYGISFERTLPNNITFGGSLKKADKTTVDLTLYIHNGSQKDLRNILLQTCAFLRHSKEFSEFTADNKFVHLPEHGWTSFPKAQEMKLENGKYLLGWRSGPKSADLPVMVTKARPEVPGAPETNHMTALTWEEHTYSLITNPNHPCMHADPFFPDLEPGQSAEIHGRLIFYKGTIEELEKKYFS